MAKRKPPIEKTAKPFIYRDGAEHKGHGWTFDETDDFAGTRVENLYTGDYSVENLYERKIFVCERKGAVTEWVQNISTQTGWRRFEDELRRLEEFRFPFLILEFELEKLLTYPKGSGLPFHLYKKVKARPPFLLKRLLEIELDFKTKVVFAGSRGREVFLSLCKRVLERVEGLGPEQQA